MEFADYSRFVFAFAFVIALIWGVAVATKKLGLDKKIRGVSGGKSRLQIREVLYLDPRRKVAMFRADKKDYLVLLSGDNAQLIDTLEVPADETV